MSDYQAGDPIPARHIGRFPGETNRDALDRLAGEVRAAEMDRAQLSIQVSRMTPVFNAAVEYMQICLLHGGTDDYHRNQLIGVAYLELLAVMRAHGALQ